MSLSYQQKCNNKDMIKFQNRLIVKECWHCCKNCINWDGKCKLYNTIPPVEVLVVGCENWEYDIPF
jgi:hypothetical protein